MAEKQVVRQDVVQITFDVVDDALKKMNDEIKKFQGDTAKSVGGAEKSLNDFGKKTQENTGKLKKFVSSLKQIDTTGIDKLNSKLDKAASKLGKGMVSASKKAAKAIASVGVAGGAGFAAMTTAAVKGYTEYEQLVGGVDTLFKENSKDVQKYASKAYQTAGMSANDYMETVTGFSASLLQSLGGDTAKAAKMSNQALIDMSDNANKMGTDMESIKYAYQGFAKSNYTMLDNLKIGYGGTQEEMKRLLKDAQKISGQKYDISSFADITEAIHVIQTEIGITGTTSKEAASTIQGSVNAMKGAWQNLLVGMADPNQNVDQLINNFVDSAIVAGKNILPRIAMAVPRVAAGLGQIIQSIFNEALKHFDALGAFAPIGQAIVGTISKLKAQFTSLTQDGTKMNTIKTIFSTMRVIIGQVVRIVGDLIVKFTSWATQTSVLNTMKTVLNGIKTALGWVSKNFNTVISVVSSAAIGFAAFYATVKTITLGMKAYNAVVAILKARQMMAAGATAAQAAAQWGANAAMLASPVTWIVVGIAALVAIIVILVKNWDKVNQVAVNCWNKIKGAWSGVSGWFKSKVVTPVKNFFAGLWEKVPAPVKTVIGKIYDGFKWAYDKVTGAWSGITDFFSGIWKDCVKAVAKPVNKLIDGANWVLDKVGSDKKFGHWEPYARGTQGHPGGNAIVNDGRGAELVQMPNGFTFIPRGRNVGIPNAPKGMKVLDAQRTAQLMGRNSPTFHYKEGSGWLDNVFDFFDDAGGLVGKVIEKYVSFKGMGGLALDVGKGIIKTAKTEMVDWVKGLFDKFGGKSLASYNPSKGVEQWRSTVVNALKMEGLHSAENVKRTLYQMQTESGGNPKAINRWDSNAKKGTPSKGLMQVIDPTFQSYARKGYNKNIYDPMSNILASVRYATSRYGSLAKAYRGVGYENGIGTVRLPYYSPERTAYASTSTNTSNNHYAPSFTLNMSGTVDRTTERTIKKWVMEAIEEMFDSMSRTSPRLTEV